MEQLAPIPGQIDIAGLLAAHASQGRVAIIGPNGAISYAQLCEQVRHAASSFIASGLDLEAPAGVALAGETDHLVATLALMALGVPSLTFPSFENANAIGSLASVLGIRQYVGEPRTDLPDHLKAIPFKLARRAGAEPPWREIGPDEPAVYRSTSGTTGKPKIFAQSATRFLVMARNAASDPAMRRVLRTSSVEYDSSRLSRIAGLIAGITGIFVAEYSAGAILDACTKAQVTQIHIGTYRLADMLAGSSTPLGPETSIVTGGSRVPGSLRKAVQERLCRQLFVAYATSEVGNVSIAQPHEHAQFPEGVGMPADGVTLEILGPGGAPVAPGEIGEARVRKAGAPRVYIGEPSASAAFNDGWFRTRDLLSQRPGEPLIFHGRADDMMILNGINIFGAAIEDTLEAMPEVAEAVAYFVESRIHGQIPVAAVVLKPGAQGLGATELIKRCRERIGYSSPRKIFVVDTIPRTALGKPLRRELPS